MLLLCSFLWKMTRLPTWRSRGYLPHYDAAGAAQHLVFRLADSLPASMVRDLAGAPTNERLSRAETALDRGAGSRLLAQPWVANIVQDALLYFDGLKYELLAWCVMPTHVHALALQSADHSLTEVVHGWKSFTAHAINEERGGKGPVWARDYFDRATRDERDREAVALYIEHNPVAAGLVRAPEDWRWSSACCRAA